MPLLTLMLLCQIVAVMGDYTYAPQPKPMDGEHALACVGISYTNPVNNYVTADRCKHGADGVASFYLRNSRGLLKLKTAGYHMDYAGLAVPSFSAAEKVAKDKFKAQYYIVPSIFRHGGNHASGGIAHVVQFTGWVWNHEVGHLLGLQHTGTFAVSARGVVTYNQYGDRDSVMGGGGTGSKYLSPPQYYGKGWLPKEEAALYQNGTVFELKQITDFEGKGLSVVVIPNKLLSKSVSNASASQGRDAFVAFPKTCPGAKCFALYFGGKGGSSKIATSGAELYDQYFTGLHVKIVNVTKSTVKVMIDFLPPPHSAQAREIQGRPFQVYDDQAEVAKVVAELDEPEDDNAEQPEDDGRDEL